MRSTLKHTYYLVFLVILMSNSVLFAGGLEKGLQALDNKDYYGAKKQFEKILFREPIGANFGLALVHYAKQNPFYDIDRALRY
ncbi:MAG: hypothetical protein HKO93_00765, partial [Flavobacteriales bacterium]|nr:hypothetical protein [Flavobacteriales bacterium]